MRDKVVGATVELPNDLRPPASVSILVWCHATIDLVDAAEVYELSVPSLCRTGRRHG